MRHPRGNKSGQIVLFKTKIGCIVIFSMSCFHIGIRSAGINENEALLSDNSHNWAAYSPATLITTSIFVILKHKRASFVVGKNYDTELKCSSTYASSCKVPARLLLKEPFLFICYIVREGFYCLFLPKAFSTFILKTTQMQERHYKLSWPMLNDLWAKVIAVPNSLLNDIESRCSPIST